MSVATAENVRTALMRELTAPETLFVAELLEVAERRLLARAPSLLSRADLDPGLRSLIADVEAEMLARIFRAPDGGLYVQEGEGDYSYRLNTQVASGRLSVSDDEWALLGIGSRWGAVSTISDAYARERFGSWHPMIVNLPEVDGP